MAWEILGNEELWILLQEDVEVTAETSMQGSQSIGSSLTSTPEKGENGMEVLEAETCAAPLG